MAEDEREPKNDSRQWHQGREGVASVEYEETNKNNAYKGKAD